MAIIRVGRIVVWLSKDLILLASRNWGVVNEFCVDLFAREFHDKQSRAVSAAINNKK